MVKVAGVRVLVADDEPDARNMVRKLLQDYDATVEVEASCAEAIEKLRHEIFDVLVSDIGMPDADGYALIRQVRAMSPMSNGKIPAIALTVYARSEDRVKSVVADFQLHVAKPVEPAELLAFVATLAGPEHFEM